MDIERSLHARCDGQVAGPRAKIVLVRFGDNAKIALAGRRIDMRVG